MANTLVFSLVVHFAVFVCSVTAARKGFRDLSYAPHGRSLASASSNYSICTNMVTPWGYTCEEHTVTTADGYILGLQRIPASRSGQQASMPPVLLQHGLIVDSVTWVYNQPSESLAFILADNGHDVWMANSRGTKSSSGHTTLTTSDEAYWEWSWDELVTYDLTATVQYVNSITGQNLHYAAHSLGTLMALAAFSQDELVNTIRAAVLLSPIAYLNNLPSLFSRTAADIFLAEELYWLGLHEFNPKGEAVSGLLNDLCALSSTFCGDLMNAFTGQNCCLNSSRSSIFFKYESQSTSTKNMIHLAQMVRTGMIRKFDYGQDGNMNHYAQTTPPAYNMTSIPTSIPLYLAYGGQDDLSDVKDVQELLAELQNHNSNDLVIQYVPQYAHADFILGVSAYQVIYNPVLAFLQRN